METQAWMEMTRMSPVDMEIESIDFMFPILGKGFNCVRVGRKGTSPSFLLWIPEFVVLPYQERPVPPYDMDKP